MYLHRMNTFPRADLDVSLPYGQPRPVTPPPYMRYSRSLQTGSQQHHVGRKRGSHSGMTTCSPVVNVLDKCSPSNLMTTAPSYRDTSNGDRDRVLGPGPILQAEGSRVRFPVSLSLQIDLVLPSTQRPSTYYGDGFTFRKCR